MTYETINGALLEVKGLEVGKSIGIDGESSRVKGRHGAWA